MDKIIINRLRHPAINKSWFARELYGIDVKHDHRVNSFIDKLHGRRGRKFSEDEIKGLENLFKGFISDLV